MIHVNIFDFHLNSQSKNLTQIANILDVDQCVPSSYVNIDTKNCVSLMAIERTNSSNNVYVTVCDGSTATMQLPIIFTTVAMILILGLSCGAIYILHRMLDPVKMLKMSRSCYPAKFLDEIWPDNQKPLLGPILHFLLNPCKQTFAETNMRLVRKSGHNLIYWSIRHGYLELIKTIIDTDIEMELTLPVIKTALLEGEAKVIKLILSNAEKQQIVTDNIPSVLKTLSEKRGIICQIQVQYYVLKKLFQFRIMYISF